MDEVTPGRWMDRRLTRRGFLGAVGAGAAGLAVAACGSSSSGTTTTGGSGTKPASSFPLGAASKSSSKPVPITMWHSMTNANLTTLQTLASRFNASQSDVKVTLVNQPSYQDTLTLYTTDLGGGALPDLVQIETIDMQLMIDSQSIVAVGDAVAADSAFNVGELLPASVAYFKVTGTLWAMPFNQSSQVMYYDQKKFEAAGLDPAKPPLTLDEYHSYAHEIVSKGVAKYGTSLKMDPSNFEDWTAQGGGLLVNQDNGRTARATAVGFNDSLGLELFNFYSEMLSSKAAQATPGTGGGAYDNLLAIPPGTAPMTIDTSAALGTILAVLGGGRYPKVKLGVGPLPAPSGPGGVPYGGAGLYISKHSPAPQQDGAWQFIKFLVSATSQATWTLGTGYIPINTKTPDLPSVKHAWTTTPEYTVAYNQILNTKPTTSTAGAVCGPLAKVEQEITNALVAISNGTSASAAQSQATSAGNQDIASYNARVS
jgi:sn-glycerol 3-phosphate transport system substrate-binding protein